MKTNYITTIAAVLFIGCFLITSSAKGQTIAAGGWTMPNYGATHSLALCADSTVKGWGDNRYGQLGDGTTADRLTPVQVSSLSRITAISAGKYHSLFLKNDGTVWACGENSYGQLGTGDTIDKITPVQVSSLSGITAIVAKGNYSLFLKNDGTVWVCGENTYGQLGDGTAINKPTPVQVSSLAGITAIASGESHSLFLKNDGTVWACGDNYYGELGDGTSFNDRLTPVRVNFLTGITAIAAGASHSLFLKVDRTVWACGYNARGALGDPIINYNVTVPFQVSTLSGITAISAAGDYSFFLKSDATVWACGFAVMGAASGLGGITSLTPIQILSGITAFAAGGMHSLFLKNDSTVWACGINYDGQVGDGTYANRNVPVKTINFCFVHPPSPQKINTITGICFIDYNQNNAHDAGEAKLPNVVVSSTGAYTDSSITDQQGEFFNWADTNSVTTKPQAYHYYTFSPAQHISNFSSYGNTDTINFAFVPIVNIQDLHIILIPLSAARPGMDVKYRIVYENVGTKTMSGSVFMAMNSGLTFVSASPAYNSLSGDTLEWTYSNLVPAESRSIDVILNVPWSTTIGTTLLPSSRIEPIATDTTPHDNYLTLEHIVTAAFDPNDKTMLQGEEITEQQVTEGDYLDYLIRFQNTGNDTAFTVMVRDTLDSKLDLNTFEMISASHNYTINRDGKNISWTFNNILLPDSNVNEPGSHGYICYRIKPNNTLVAGDSIKNTAYIYFDYNVPVVTNTAVTTVTFPTGIHLTHESSAFHVFPNPADEKITVATDAFMPLHIEFYNVLGEAVLNLDVQKQNSEIDISSLQKGIYFLKGVAGDKYYSAKLVVQ